MFIPNKSMKIVILGAGPTGLGAAYRLAELGALNLGHSVTIFDQADAPGGLSSSVRDENGFLWDLGGHVLFSHYEYFDRVMEESVADWNIRTRAAFAYIKGADSLYRFVPYPVQNHIGALCPEDQQKCLDGLDRLPEINQASSNFDEWLQSHFGSGLCDLFMTKYNQKVWTVHPREMNALWMGERVAVPDANKIRATLATYTLPSGRDDGWGPNSTFRYPSRGGTGQIWKNVSTKCPPWFELNTQVVAVDPDNETVTVRKGESEFTLGYDVLINTLPLDRLLSLFPSNVCEKIKGISGSRLERATTYVVGIGLSGKPPACLADKTWLYFPEQEVPFYRVTVFSNYSEDHTPDPSRYWSLLCECSLKPGSDESDLLERTIGGLVGYNFITEDQIVSRFTTRLDHGYPIPFLERESLLHSIHPVLEDHSIFSRGRFGGWRYEVSNQDHSFMQGVEVVDRILFGVPEVTYPEPNRINTGPKKMGRFPLWAIPSFLPFEIVVAYYNEDLSWLLPYRDVAHIYCKRSDDYACSQRFDFLLWESLPNVGREGHTYLTHIINNYDRLADVTFFTQGALTALESCWAYNSPTKYRSLAQDKGIGFVPPGEWSHWGRIEHVGKWKEELETGKMTRARCDFATLWRDLFGQEPPNEISVTYNGIFSVRRDVIQKRPIEFYRKLRSYLEGSCNPEEGHYVERLWYYIFSTLVTK